MVWTKTCVFGLRSLISGMRLNPSLCGKLMSSTIRSQECSLIAFKQPLGVAVNPMPEPGYSASNNLRKPSRTEV